MCSSIFVKKNFFEEIHKSQKQVHDALNLFIIAAI